jgi:(4-O-methyl)-D-glucuronate---lignin esterase
VPLHLDPCGSVFVVFRRSATGPSRTIPPASSTALATVEGPWSVTFPPDWGAPPQVTLQRLGSWTDSPEAGVKYFSGTATYAKDVQVPGAWLRPGSRLMLDLGDVKELAEVTVNGKPVGILWTPPFRVDVSGAVRSGSNQIEIKVTNLWTNRMIGDQELPPEKRFTFSTYDPYDKTSPLGRRMPPNQLIPSGLLGPVTFSSSTRP